jgi:hypothetical protein
MLYSFPFSIFTGNSEGCLASGPFLVAIFFRQQKVYKYRMLKAKNHIASVRTFENAGNNRRCIFFPHSEQAEFRQNCCN